MSEPIRFAYSLSKKSSDGTALLPFMPLTLSAGSRKLEVVSLLDSGSTINVLPFLVGLELGLDWTKMDVPVPLAGNLASLDAFGVVLSGQIGAFKPIDLVFAWAKSDQIPLILGQNNFFHEFNVCFFRAAKTFEIRQKP